jgi:integrase
VNQQVRKGKFGPPKGRARRKVPMNTTLVEALRGLINIRRGFVVRNADGSPLTDGQTTHAIYRICRRAGLPERAWHTLRHSFGTHAAMLGVNPWRLMAWMGHKTISQTMRYVHVAEEHARPIPAAVLKAGEREPQPDARVLKMLAARSWHLYGTPACRETGTGT